MYVMTLNLNTSVTPWHEAHTNGTNFVCRADGGVEFYNMFGEEYASKEYIIKPDFTWEFNDQASDSTLPAIGSEYFTSRGIYEHQCGGTHTTITTQSITSENHVNLAGNSLRVEVTADALYDITIYSVSGQVVQTIPRQHLSAGVHSFDLGLNRLSNGIYFAEMRWGSELLRQRLMAK